MRSIWVNAMLIPSAKTTEPTVEIFIFLYNSMYERNQTTGICSVSHNAIFDIYLYAYVIVLTPCRLTLVCVGLLLSDPHGINEESTVCVMA